MKSLFSLMLVIFGTASIFAQLTNNGATIKVESGAVLYVDGDIQNNLGTFTMDSGSKVELTGNFTNAATVNASGTSELKFSGTSNSNLTSGTASFQNVKLDKTSADVFLLDEALINTDLEFVADDNKLVLNGNDLSLAATATVTGADDNQYVVTGASAELIKEDLTNFTYPVGYDDITYNPVTIVEAGTSDDKGVTVLENAYEDGTSTGTQIMTDVVNATWLISESTAGGSDMTITPQWVTADESAGFDRNFSGVSNYDASAYDLLYADLSAATGTDPYTAVRSASDKTGAYIVGGKPATDYVALAPRVFLTGPLVGATMGDALRTNNLIPLSEPYDAMTQFTHVAFGGGEDVAAAADFDATGTDDDIVDWVFVELRDGASNTTVVATQAALLQRDGDIVDEDMNDLKFNGIAPGNYFVAVNHRNHLSIMSNAAIALGHSATIVDFTDGSTTTYGTDAQKVAGTTYSLWPGDVDVNGNLEYTGNDVFTIFLNTLTHASNVTFDPNYSYSDYLGDDVDMNGTIEYTGNDVFTLFLNILTHPANTTFDANFNFMQQMP